METTMKIHILGIAGTMTTPLALALKSSGHTITGSDQEKIYPPFSQMLLNSGISINPEIKSLSPDLVIVGSAYDKFKNTKAEFDYFKIQKIPYISATQYIATNLIKTNSILIAGSYGKTTISAALSWVLNKNGFNPSYFFGGQSQNLFPSLRFTSSDWSVVEADESINGLDTQAKFLYYPVKYLCLTSALWEHKESYFNLSNNTAAFVKLVKNIPKDGLLVYNQLEPSAVKLTKFARCSCFPYRTTDPTNHLFGRANQNNLAAVTTLCSQLGLSPTKIKPAINSFKGIKRRMELISTINNTEIYDDFAQSPKRISESLLALRKKYPKNRILVIFEPHASFLQYSSSIINLNHAFKPAAKIFLSKLSFTTKLPKSIRTSFSDYKLALGAKLIYLPLYSDLQSSVLSSLKPGDILIHFSSGGLSGLNNFKKIINKYKLNSKN